MLNLVQTKQELDALKVDDAGQYDGNAALHYTEKLRRFVIDNVPLLLAAAEAGLALSRMAAASERQNQQAFLDLLFEDVVEVQNLVGDDRRMMQRELPTVQSASPQKGP